MNSKSDNIEIIINDADEADEFIKELFGSLQNRYQNNLLESMKFSDFVFNCLQLLFYKCHEINFKRGRSYIDSPDWIKNKRTTVNSFYKNDWEYFHYALTVVLNHEEIGKNSERITNIKRYIDKYNLKGINYSSEKDD